MLSILQSHFHCAMTTGIKHQNMYTHIYTPQHRSYFTLLKEKVQNPNKAYQTLHPSSLPNYSKSFIFCDSLSHSIFLSRNIRFLSEKGQLSLLPLDLSLIYSLFRKASPDSPILGYIILL